MKTCDEITLEYGPHSSAEAGMCMTEAVAYIAGEPFSAYPACACLVLASYGRALNDVMPDNATRNRLLRPLVPRLIGTVSSRELQLRRAYLAAEVTGSLEAAEAVRKGLAVLAAMRAAHTAAWTGWDRSIVLFNRMIDLRELEAAP